MTLKHRKAGLILREVPEVPVKYPTKGCCFTDEATGCGAGLRRGRKGFSGHDGLGCDSQRQEGPDVHCRGHRVRILSSCLLAQWNMPSPVLQALSKCCLAVLANSCLCAIHYPIVCLFAWHDFRSCTPRVMPSRCVYNCLDFEMVRNLFGNVHQSRLHVIMHCMLVAGMQRSAWAGSSPMCGTWLGRTLRRPAERSLRWYRVLLHTLINELPFQLCAYSRTSTFWSN